MKKVILFFVLFVSVATANAQSDFSMRNDSLFYKTEFWYTIKHKVNASGGYKYLLIDSEKKVHADFTIAAQNNYLFLCDVIFPEVQKAFNSTFLSEKTETHEMFFLAMLQELYKDEVFLDKKINAEKLAIYCKENTFYLNKYSKAAYYVTYPVE